MNGELAQYEHAIPEWKAMDDILKVYIWNRGRCQLHVDDFYIGLEEFYWALMFRRNML